MIVTPLQTSFASGELSPRVSARVDLDVYWNAAAYLENFIVVPHGPLLRRQGTRFINKAKSLKVRLIDFKFNTEQSFILEFSALTMRVYFKGGVIEKAGSVYEVATPYTAEQLSSLNWAQSGNVLYIVHPSHAPRKLKRLANDNWTLEEVTFTDKPAGWAGTNYPSVVTFHEQRLYYAATPNEPQTIWGSRIGLFDEFTKKNSSGEVVDDMAIEYTIASDDVNGIKWLKAIDILAAGTSGAEYRVSSGTLNEALTPSNMRISPQTNYGSAAVRPVQLGSGIIFVQRSKNRIRSFEYLFTDNQYTATDLTVLAEHIAQAGVKEMALQTAKDTYLWCCTDTGDIIALTYEKQQKVVAWHRHSVGGKVVSLTTIPGEKADEVWIAVQRTVNGQLVTYIEAFIDAFSETTDVVHGAFVDSHLTYEGPEVEQISGLAHLEGLEVSILVDGWVHPNRTVVAGKVTLQSPGKVIHIGLPYVSEFHSTSIQATDMVSSGRLKRVISADISLLYSLGFEFGLVGGSVDTAFMGPTKIMNKAQDLFTGVKKVSIPGSSANDQQLLVRQTLPLPCIIRAIKYNTDIN